MVPGLKDKRLDILISFVRATKGQTNLTFTPQEDPEMRDVLSFLEDRRLIVPRGIGQYCVTRAGVDVAEEIDAKGEQSVSAKTSESTGTRLFVSHASKDVDIVHELVDLLEAVLQAPAGTIRCTSVPGYKLEPGASAGQTLRQNLQDCEVVIAVLTRTSLDSKYVLLELGAAWAFQKTSCLLLTPGVSFGDLPGPFRDVHALQATSANDVAQLIDLVEKKCGMSKRTDTSRLQTKIGQFVEKASALAKPAEPTSGDSPAEPPPAVPADMSDDTAKMKLVIWLKAQGGNVASGTPVELATVDREAGIPNGYAERLLKDPEVLGERWEIVKQSGGYVVLRRHAERVRDVRSSDRFGRGRGY